MDFITDFRFKNIFKSFLFSDLNNKLFNTSIINLSFFENFYTSRSISTLRHTNRMFYVYFL